jgi:hypothetical protein
LHILLHQKILSLHQFLQNCSMWKCHCYLQHKKEKRKKNSSSSTSALSLSLSLSQIRKKDKNVDAAQCSKQASKQATPEAPHSWSWPSKIVKNLGEELDETDR